MQPLARRRDNLAIAYQEVLTAIVRFRSNPDAVGDAAGFRAHMRAAIQTAEQAAAQRGYSNEDVKLSTFASVAFLDESVLNSRNPVFVEWPRKPLQEELFGVHVAGEIFFRNIERLLTRGDSQELADVLEIYLLCLTLGFRGRYGMGDTGGLRATADALRDKIARIRGPMGPLSPMWSPPAEIVRVEADPWIKRLVIGAVVCCGLAVVAFALYYVLLRSGISELRGLSL